MLLMNQQRLEIVSGKAPFHSRFYLWIAKTRDALRGLRLRPSSATVVPVAGDFPIVRLQNTLKEFAFP
jgi:hypothetical protein